MWLIAGLGNPGPKYALTRHNIGFLALDLFAQSLVGHGASVPWKEEHKAHVCRLKVEDSQVILAKPMTFMNKSGESLVSLMQFYKIELDHILVLQDDIDQSFKQIRFHKNRGHGGHNGIRSISELLGTADYTRLKLGIGRPINPEMQVADYVLGKFSIEEQTELPDFLNHAGDAIDSLMFEGLNKASTKFNGG